ncbi:hypothetical protein MLD38_005140 [Melastoma candidum]|uniref:Uncharacterized protein n=1 Tax=Melastoma candidum TaxID=119954 RepID=A0ACB9S7U4_9MYRT|nr:hypothetical protein MLD38_005140 [Melastoma candidum]
MLRGGGFAAGPGTHHCGKPGRSVVCLPPVLGWLVVKGRCCVFGALKRETANFEAARGEPVAEPLLEMSEDSSPRFAVCIQASMADHRGKDLDRRCNRTICTSRREAGGPPVPERMIPLFCFPSFFFLWKASPLIRSATAPLSRLKAIIPPEDYSLRQQAVEEAGVLEPRSLGRELRLMREIARGNLLEEAIMLGWAVTAAAATAVCWWFHWSCRGDSATEAEAWGKLIRVLSKFSTKRILGILLVLRSLGSGSCSRCYLICVLVSFRPALENGVTLSDGGYVKAEGRRC